MKTQYKLNKEARIIALTGLIIGAIMMASNTNNTYAESSSANASVTVANTITLTLTGGDLVIDNLTFLA